MTNFLYYGDNLQILRDHVDNESVDLVYLDPPFNSNQDFNAFFTERDGTRAAAQVLAFDDTWSWDQAAVAAVSLHKNRNTRRPAQHCRE